MPRPHTPPDVLTQIVAEYEKTGNACEVARRLGLPRSTVRDALYRAKSATRRHLHARACEAGLRQGRKALRAELVRLGRYTTAAVGGLEDDAPPALEPRDYAALVRAQTDLNRVLIQHDERACKRHAERIERDILRLKREALRGLGVDLSGATDEELATVRAIIERARTRGPTPSDPDRASKADQGAGQDTLAE
jgi:hypothetical protein